MISSMRRFISKFLISFRIGPTYRKWLVGSFEKIEDEKDHVRFTRYSLLVRSEWPNHLAVVLCQRDFWAE